MQDDQLPTPLNPDDMDEIQLRAVVKNVLVNCGAYLMVGKVQGNEVVALIFGDGDIEEIHIPRIHDHHEGDNLVH